jgi:ElaB/YqjD/DUF883 family membrane-anchored ribosome-binding protein
MKFAKNQKQRNPRYFLKEGWFGFGDDEPEAPKEDAFEKITRGYAEDKARDKAAIDSARQEFEKLQRLIYQSLEDDSVRAEIKLEDLKEKVLGKLQSVYGDEAKELKDEIHKFMRYGRDKLYDLKQKEKSGREAEQASQYRPEPEYDVLADPATDRYETRRGTPPAGGQLYVRREGITKSRLKQIIREEIKRLQK